jgi:hypothetical protein
MATLMPIPAGGITVATLAIPIAGVTLTGISAVLDVPRQALSKPWRVPIWTMVAITADQLRGLYVFIAAIAGGAIAFLSVWWFG